MLAFAAPESATAALQGLLKPQSPVKLQQAAIVALGDLPGSEGALAVLAQWKALGPEPRRDAVEILLRDRTRTEGLLAAIEAQSVKTSNSPPSSGSRSSVIPTCRCVNAPPSCAARSPPIAKP